MHHFKDKSEDLPFLNGQWPLLHPNELEIAWCMIFLVAVHTRRCVLCSLGEGRAQSCLWEEYEYALLRYEICRNHYSHLQRGEDTCLGSSRAETPSPTEIGGKQLSRFQMLQKWQSVHGDQRKLSNLADAMCELPRFIWGMKQQVESRQGTWGRACTTELQLWPSLGLYYSTIIAWWENL